MVGEDGLDGIALDTTQYPGSAFCDFQATVLHLAERDVLLPLCRKKSRCFEVLDKHPAMRLKRKHLAGWRVNWQDKASNIAAMAEELNLGLDVFVFVDDSPLERDLVREMLPQVTVLQVPKKLHELPMLLLQLGLFDTLHVTDEDHKRAQLYQSESQRKTVRSAFGNLQEYLHSLQTVASIHRATPAELSSVTQLTQNTNQLNLTTRCYSEGDLQAFVNSAEAAVHTLSVGDRFGSLGLVGAMVVKMEGNIARADTFLMSCRALGRRLEAAMVRNCMTDMNRLAASTSAAPRDWHAEFIPTAKNSPGGKLLAPDGLCRGGCATKWSCRSPALPPGCWRPRGGHAYLRHD